MITADALDRADSLNRQLWDTVFGSNFPGEIVSHKTVLLIAYVDLAIEHHSAITLLVRRHHTGSAMVLVRSVFEMLYRGTWILGCTSEVEAEQARRDQLKWPEMSTLVMEADRVFETEGFFHRIKGAGWKVMNSYTHSGALQVSRRFSGNDLNPSYSDDEQEHAVYGTLIAAGLLAIPFLKFHDRVAEAERVESLILELS